MPYASVVPDIPTRALDGAFDYLVPNELAQACRVGATVLVSFGHRDVVGYVTHVADAPSQGVDASRILPVRQVLAEPAFDGAGARLAEWMAREYAAPLSACLRLMLAPGRSIRAARAADGTWQLAGSVTREVDDRWVGLSPEAADYVPRANATRQREVLEALAQGPQRVAELAATIPGAASVVSVLARRGVVAVERRRRVRGAGGGTSLSSAAAPRPERLTAGQLRALEAIDRAVAAAAGDVVLVDGVTGSGKTEVYLDAIERVVAAGRTALVLVPEISLTAQTVGRFRNRFGDEVAVLHSRLSAGERFDQWDMARRGLARVVVGARSALFAPLANLGLVIVDEEHELSYKQDQAPRYHARDVAARLAGLRGAALVLGSATPSLESLGRCRAGGWGGARWERVEMPERPGGAALPAVRVVDMRRQGAARGGSVFSRELADALLERAERREKSVLLLNRRGFASFLMCRDCGCVPTCTHCSTSLTYHERTHSLVCHSCGRTWPVRAWPDPSTRCPNCGSRYLAQCGVGTQRVEDELRMLLDSRAPGARPVDVIRMDADTTAAKGAHQRLLERFDASECAVLVGTQMIAKGLDFPEVTLVGVVDADTSLKLPDFRAAERTYDLLEQVAGRAGRGGRPGEVIVQSRWATHPAIDAVARHDRDEFVRYELEQRGEAYYPPCSRLGNVVVTGASEPWVSRLVAAIAQGLRGALPDDDAHEVLGPAECVRGKVKDRYRRHVVVKVPVTFELGPVLARCVRAAERACAMPGRRGPSVAIDVDAYDLM